MNIIIRFLDELRVFLERIDAYRDKVLFIFIKPYWPRFISPNHLTFARIIIGLFLFVTLFYFKDDNGTLIISLFFVGVLTDLLDGSVARGLNKVTKLGTILDPIADRIIIITIAVYSLFSSHPWLLLLVIILELVNALISVYAQSKNVFLEPNIFGKIKMLLQSIVFLAILFFWPGAPNLFFIYILWFSVIFMLVSIYMKIVEVKQLPR